MSKQPEPQTPSQGTQLIPKKQQFEMTELFQIVKNHKTDETKTEKRAEPCVQRKFVMP